MKKSFAVAIVIGVYLTFVSPGLAAPEPAAPASIVPTPANPHAHLKQILDRPLYKAWRLRQDEANSADPLTQWGDMKWLTRKFDWIDDFFDWLFKSPPHRATPPVSRQSGAGLPAILKAVAWGVLALAVLFIVILLIKTFGRPKLISSTARVLSRQQIRDAMESGDALALGTAEWMDEAARLAAEQDFRAVYRALYLALLSGLHTVGKIEHSANRTNWTYVRTYRGPAAERDTFGDLTALFDRVWYGRLAAEGDDLAALRRKVAMLTSPAKSASAPVMPRSPA